MTTRRSLRSPHSGRRRLGASERRERILSGAMEVFAERGYEGASMIEIAAAGDVTAAVIYDHFPSKAALQIELLEQQTNDLLMAVGSAVAETSGSARERMRVGCDMFFAFVEKNPFAWRMILRDPPSDPEVAAAHKRINDQATAAIALLIEQTDPPGFERYPDPRETSRAFAEMMKMSLNALAIWWYENRHIAREQIVERLLDFCWVGMRNMAGPPPHSASNPPEPGFVAQLPTAV